MFRIKKNINHFVPVCKIRLKIKSIRKKKIAKIKLILGSCLTASIIMLYKIEKNIIIKAMSDITKK